MLGIGIGTFPNPLGEAALFHLTMQPEQNVSIKNSQQKVIPNLPTGNWSPERILSEVRRREALLVTSENFWLFFFNPWLLVLAVLNETPDIGEVTWFSFSDIGEATWLSVAAELGERNSVMMDLDLK